MGLYVKQVYGCCLVLLLAVNNGWAQDTDQLLLEAVKARDFATAEALLLQGTDVDAAQPDGATALHWAVYHDTLVTADVLISAGADVDASNDYGVTPLALACENGSAVMVSRLLEAEANTQVRRNSGETPLMTCARTGNVDAVKALLVHGAEANAVEAWQGQTALMWAVGEGHTEVAKTLIERGADVSVRSKSGFSAILIGARQNDPGLARLLIDAGANVNDQAPNGGSPLLVATVRGHAALAIALLELGADPNTTEAGYTALHWAAGSWHTELTGPRGIVREREEEWRSLNGLQNRKLDLVEALLAYGADPQARLVRSPPQFGFASGRFRVSMVGATSFLLAAMDASVEVMEALAAAGADPLLGTDEGTTPLMVAAGLGQVPAESRVGATDSFLAVELVLALGASVNLTNQRGRTALHGAAHIRSDPIVQLLVDRGAQVDVEDDRGVTPLMIAEGGGHILLPGLGGGSTAELLRELGSRDVARDSFIENFSQGLIR